jgi:hypothetical protein
MFPKIGEIENCISKFFKISIRDINELIAPSSLVSNSLTPFRTLPLISSPQIIYIRNRESAIGLNILKKYQNNLFKIKPERKLLKLKRLLIR